jgi:peroxiredoxin
LKVFAIGIKESAEQASSWSSRHQLTYPVIIDLEGEVYKKFGTGSVPYHVLIDKDFRVCLSQEDFKKGRIIEKIEEGVSSSNRSSRKLISLRFIRGLFTLVRKTHS